ITGFVTVSGDRHSFWAGLAAKALPPTSFDPVGIAFITGSISAPGTVEANEHKFPKDHPLSALFVGQASSDPSPQPTVNLLLHHVRHRASLWRRGEKPRLEATQVLEGDPKFSI